MQTTEVAVKDVSIHKMTWMDFNTLWHVIRCQCMIQRMRAHAGPMFDGLWDSMEKLWEELAELVLKHIKQPLKTIKIQGRRKSRAASTKLRPDYGRDKLRRLFRCTLACLRMHTLWRGKLYGESGQVAKKIANKAGQRAAKSTRPWWHDRDAHVHLQTSFRSSAPTLWNNLSNELKDNDISRTLFKSGLKTWLYEHAYM